MKHEHKLLPFCCSPVRYARDISSWDTVGSARYCRASKKEIIDRLSIFLSFFFLYASFRHMRNRKVAVESYYNYS